VRIFAVSRRPTGREGALAQQRQTATAKIRTSSLRAPSLHEAFTPTTYNQAFMPPSLAGYLPSTRREWIIALVIFSAFLASSHLGRYLFTSPAVISPTAGVAMAGMVLGGIVMWPAVFFASLASGLINGSSWISLIGFPLVNTLQAIAGAYLLKKAGFDPLFGRRRDVFSFLLISLIVSATVPSFGFAIRALDTWLFQAPALTVTWGAWWAGTLLSLIIVGGFLLRWIAKPKPHPRTSSQITEIIVASAVLALITLPLFWTETVRIGGVSLVYFLLFPLFWIALRLGPRLLTAALLFVTVNAVLGLMFGPHAIPAEELGLRIFNIEIFLNIIAVMFFILVGIEEERKTINYALRSHVGRLEDALAQLSQQNQAKSDFLAVLAHELRNPLAPLLSTVELLKLKHTPAKDAEELRMLDAAEERVRTMAHLLDDLLDISRISQATFELQKEDIELHTAVMRSIEIAKPLMDLREHALSTDLPEEKIWMHVDPVRLEQMLVNLLTNAAKYTERGGKIEVSARRDPRGLSISVRDNGIGIQPEMLDRVFEPFQQVPTKRASGLGIGLSIVKKLAEMHDGSITVFSQGLGKGSTFTLSLPASAVHLATTHTAEKPRPSPLVSSAFKVLVVDDNHEAAQGLGKLLTLRGHDVTLAYAGSDAISTAKREEPNIILLDIGLPDMDGYEVARSLREDETGSALIALTGYGQEEDKQRAKNAGFDYHLTKPVGLAEIEAIFARIEGKAA
jgi:signal transduction histidine kinase